MAGPNNRIVILTDLTEQSDIAMSTGLQLALEQELMPYFIHVLEPVDPSFTEVVKPLRHTLLDTYRQRWAEQVQQAGFEFFWVEYEGQPFVETLRYAQNINAQFVVARNCVYQKRDEPKKLRGSVAHRLARHSDRPILFAKQPTKTYDHALVMVDFSDNSRMGCHAVIDLLPAAATVHLLHCIEVPLAVSESDSFALHEFNYGTMAENLKEEAQMKLDAFAETIDFGGRDIRTHVSSGSAVEFGLWAIDTCDVDLVAVGTQGRHAILSVLLGSVAEGMLDLAPCDVLIAPPPGRTFNID